MRRRQFVSALAMGAALGSVGARAQQPGRVYRLAIAHPTAPIERMTTARAPRFLGATFGELRQRGYVDGQNLTVEPYSGEGKPALFPPLAVRVVATKPLAVLAISNGMTQAFKAATDKIPIVMVGSDPLGSGLVSSLAHPGGNITGVTVDAGVEIAGKRLELLRQAVPGAVQIAYLTSRAIWNSSVPGRPVTATRDAAKSSGVTLLPALLDVVDEAGYRRAFAQAAQDGADTMLVGDDAEHYPRARLIAELALSNRLPALLPDRSFADEGGMISYGIDFPDLFRRAGNDIAEILGGAKPADIPFYRPTRYELVINLKTAKALGVAMPPTLLAGADDVIE